MLEIRIDQAGAFVLQTAIDWNRWHLVMKNFSELRSLVSGFELAYVIAGLCKSKIKFWNWVAKMQLVLLWRKDPFSSLVSVSLAFETCKTIPFVFQQNFSSSSRYSHLKFVNEKIPPSELPKMNIFHWICHFLSFIRLCFVWNVLPLLGSDETWVIFITECFKFASALFGN